MTGRVGLTVPRPVLRLLSASVQPTDDDITVSRKRLLTGGGVVAPLALIAAGTIYLAYGVDLVGGLYVGFALYIWLDVALYFRLHWSYEFAFWVSAIPTLPIHLIAIIQLGNLVHSSAIVLWGLAYPIATGIVFVPVRRLAPLFALYLVNLIVAVSVGPTGPARLPRGPETAVLVINLLGLSTFAVVILAVFVTQRDVAFRLLREEQRKSRSLLLSILPEEIADELTRSPHVIAEQFDEVSVLFADVVDFTPMSEAMTPGELVQLLDELFARFDDLVEHAGLEKIKTIGDCYMVAAGIPRPRGDHARAVVALALQMQRAVEGEIRGRRLSLRIGVNSGPVVAGVIGRRKFSYDLWGDVVNTASRMESHGVPGGVQITEATHALVSGDFRCEPRGSVEVKGKGSLTSWLVTGPRTQPSPRRS